MMVDYIIAVHYKSFRMNLNLSTYLVDASINHIKKIFRLMAAEPDKNTQAFETTDLYFQQAIAEARTAWETASKTYSNEYKDPHGPWIKSDDRIKIERQNAKLLTAMKNAHKKYEYFMKLQAYYKEATKNI